MYEYNVYHCFNLNPNQGDLLDYGNENSFKSTCFAESVDIDGNLFQSNVVDNLYNITSAKFSNSSFIFMQDFH